MNSVHELGSQTTSKKFDSGKYQVKTDRKWAECTECKAPSQPVRPGCAPSAQPRPGRVPCAPRVPAACPRPASLPLARAPRSPAARLPARCCRLRAPRASACCRAPACACPPRACPCAHAHLLALRTPCCLPCLPARAKRPLRVPAAPSAPAQRSAAPSHNTVPFVLRYNFGSCSPSSRNTLLLYCNTVRHLSLLSL